MTMRQIIHDVVTSSPLLIAEIPADRWFSGSAADEMNVHPFAVLRMTGEGPGVRSAGGPRGLEIWVHDTRGSYVRIDRVHATLKQLLIGTESLSGGDGSILMQIDWVSDSPDLFDDGHRTNTKMSSYRLVGKD